MNSTDPPSLSANNTAMGPLYSTGEKIGLTSAYITIFVMALFGNSIGLYVVSKKAPSKRITDLLIKNLAIADLIFTLTVMPHSVMFMYFEDDRWIGGTVGTITCKVFFYSIPVSVAASVITLVVISFDRFFAIYFPLSQAVFHKHKTITTVIWFTSLITMTPNLLLYQVSKTGDQYSCFQVWPWSNDEKETLLAIRVLHIFAFILLYALPMLIIAVVNCLVARRVWFHKSPGHSSSFNTTSVQVTRRKVVKMLVVIVVVFAICWLPTYVNHYFMYFQLNDWYEIPIAVRHFMFWVSHANSAINPLLYIAFNKNFRYAFIDATATLFALPVRATRACMAFFLEEQSRQALREQTVQPARPRQHSGFRVAPTKAAVVTKNGTGKTFETKL